MSFICISADEVHSANEAYTSRTDKKKEKLPLRLSLAKSQLFIPNSSSFLFPSSFLQVSFYFFRCCGCYTVAGKLCRPKGYTLFSISRNEKQEEEEKLKQNRFHKDCCQPSFFHFFLLFLCSSFIEAIFSCFSFFSIFFSWFPVLLSL